MSEEKNFLLRKYNVPAPRYTSYPTVPYWETTPSEAQWVDFLSGSISQAERDGAGAALYIHIPFCEKLCTFCGCNTRITRNHDVSVPYVDVVLKEWGLYKRKLKLEEKPLQVAEMHLGGGTPTFLSPDELRRLIEPILADIDVKDGAEFSAEIDPRVTTEEHLKTLFELGFRRVSLGVQDFDPKVQEIVNREQSFEQVKKITDAAREIGFNSVNFDLIYGLPLQTEVSVAETFDAVMRLRPDRIAFYAYAHVPWIKPTHRRFTEHDLPEGDVKRKLYELGRSRLEAAGYREIGMDHFALETDSLWKAVKSGNLHRNFMGYMARHVSPLLGLGVSAISDSWTAFIQNEKTLEKYRNRVLDGKLPILRGHVLTTEDQVLRRHILNLMTKFETEWSREDLMTSFLADLPDRLQELAKDGLVDMDDKLLKIHDDGRAFIRNISMAFDARLARKAPQTSLFSKSI